MTRTRWSSFGAGTRCGRGRDGWYRLVLVEVGPVRSSQRSTLPGWRGAQRQPGAGAELGPPAPFDIKTAVRPGALDQSHTVLGAS
jgi:hypothetical protein